MLDATWQETLDRGSGCFVEFLAQILVRAPFCQRELINPVPQRDLDQPLFDQAEAGWLGQRVAQLNQAVVHGVLEPVQIGLDEVALLDRAIPRARESANIL